MAARIVAYIAASVDGYIADARGSTDWLAPFEQGVDYGYEAFIRTIATVVMGRASFEQAHAFETWPYPQQRSLVLTRRPPPAQVAPRVEFRQGPAGPLAAELREGEGDVWVMGGGDVLAQFLSAGAIDHADLFVIPLLLGDGVRLFPPGDFGGELTLEESQAFPNGVVRLRYRPQGRTGR